MHYPPPRPVPMDWVATPPPGPPAPASPRRFGPYTGPPSYRSTPRWGFPALAWRWPTAVPTNERTASVTQRLRERGKLAIGALVGVATFSVLTAVAEIWRYTLLVKARTSALPRGTVALSDSLVITGAVVSIAFGVAAVAALLWWLVPARRAAQDGAGYASARPMWQVLVGVVVPGLNLVVPGAVVAELEHAAMRKPGDERPSPSGLVRWWWIALAAGGVMFAVSVLWRLRDSVQAKADGVLLSAATDLVAAVVAVLTLLVVLRISALLAPVDPDSVRLMRVIRVDGAPAPELRTHRTPGASR
ncbi:PROBABLE CONSERVED TRANSMEMBRANE PROTEIN [Alloactinosynnema sp. L-07]|uniref:DUF4328 domain-containing protein n=1 Tax=Alloactinosynnema sp. L-07 TaxID=1653480 RepID=UPI00065EF41E|nr:DUF4328 domain-containing protein [Alloactinosynnema sp. L-07]CRK60810.1 PROBABLE CONSERVED TRANSMEMBRANE PROTEIN [Alloactinosynnema sp. L-07]